MSPKLNLIPDTRVVSDLENLNGQVIVAQQGPEEFFSLVSEIKISEIELFVRNMALADDAYLMSFDPYSTSVVSSRHSNGSCGIVLRGVASIRDFDDWSIECKVIKLYPHEQDGMGAVQYLVLLYPFNKNAFMATVPSELTTCESCIGGGCWDCNYAGSY